MARRFTAFVALFATVGVAHLAAATIHVNTNTSMLLDAFGRERYFHGVNVVYKAFPWHPQLDEWNPRWSLVAEDMQYMQRWGFNGVRLGVMWPGVEPTRGNYNASYLSTMRGITDQLASYNIYTLVDMHQDCLSEKFCGEGVPLYAADTTGAAGFPLPFQKKPYPVDSNGVPPAANCSQHSWSEYQATEAASLAYQNIYSNVSGLQDRFGTYWQKVAAAFKTSEFVIGYELMNEPWAGNVWKDPLLTIPGVADKKNLQPMYDNLNAYIRAVDADHIIMFESVTWDDFIPVGFDHPPGGSSFADRSALSYHYYNPPNFNASMQLSSRFKDIRRLHIGGMLTEFDINNFGPAGSADMLYTMEQCDEYRQSWLGWEFKPYVEITGWGVSVFNPNSGAVNEGDVANLARTYPQAVAGQVSTMSFANDTAVFMMRFAANTTITQATEVFVSEEHHYPSGFNVTVLPAGAQTWSYDQFVDKVSGIVSFTHATWLEQGADVVIEIRPSAA